MRIGAAIPTAIRGTTSDVALNWAVQVDAGPFQSLAVIDRVVYDSFEPFVLMAAVAATTKRVELMTTVIVATLRNPVLLAKQAMSVQAISDGRFTLGLGVGAMVSEFEAVGASFADRGTRFEGDLELIKTTMAASQHASDSAVGPMGIAAPSVLIGANTKGAVARIGRNADGFIAGSRSTMEGAARLFAHAEAAWRDAGRSGSPRFVGGAYYALGPTADALATEYIADYYAGDAAMGAIREGVLTSEAQLRRVLSEGPEYGMDDFVLWPCSNDIGQLDRVADIVTGREAPQA
jgi:alkanesulfonate monooxygenase SsuD/methylene tetrahydromethanopterin reductase-like flavin-dependent oxidoreductase (luciferase family)